MLRNQIDNHFYQINSRADQPNTDEYLVQRRSQAKSSGIKIPEIHGANKGLDPHVKPGKQRPLPTIPIHNVNKGLPTHPIPKPRIGRGRAGLRRKVKTNQRMLLPQQTPAQPITTHVPKVALPLPEPNTQSQVDVLSQHVPIPLPQHQPVDPTCIILWKGPKIQHRPSPPYHDPYARPPPRPPDVTGPIDSQKDLLDNDLHRNVNIEENSPFQEGIISEIYERPDTSYVQEPKELQDLIDTTKLIPQLSVSISTRQLELLLWRAGPTAQHMQDFPIFFIQLNYVCK